MFEEMAEMKIAILSPIWPATIEQLERRYCCVAALNPSVEEKTRALAEAEIAILRSPVVLDRRTLERASRLRLVIRAGMGVDTIDLECAHERGIEVVLVPLSAQSVAEHVFALILAVCRRVPWLHRTLVDGRWEKHNTYGREVFGKTLGIVGFGRIGVCVADIAQAFRMTLLAYDRSPGKPAKQAAAARLGVQFTDLERLCSTADIVTIQLPGGDATHGLFGARLLGLMNPDAVLVNVGRGGIVDEEALYVALRDRRIGGAALDVFASEPPRGSPLLALDNFVGTPHVAAQTVEAQEKVGHDVLEVVDAFVRRNDLSRFAVRVS